MQGSHNQGLFRRASLLGCLIAVMSAATAASASAATETTTIFPLDSAVRATAITAGPDGNIWFLSPIPSPRIGQATPSGQVIQFPLAGTPREPAGRSGITTGPDGNLWFTTGYASGKVGRITTNGEVTEFPLSAESNRPGAIAAGPDGNLWFTEEAANRLGRITTWGAVTEFPLSPGAGPAGIVAGPDGNLWFTEKSAGRIGRITPAGNVTEYQLPGTGSMPSAITVGPDGNLWFTEETRAQVGRITTAGKITEFPVPGEGTTRDIVSGPAGDLWFSVGTEIGSISPAGRTARPSCLGMALCNQPPASLATGPEGNLWFGTGTADTMGGGGTQLAARDAPGGIGKFFPPSLTVAIGLRPTVVGRRANLRIGCRGGAAGSRCEGVLRLTKRLAANSSRPARTLFMGQRRFSLLSEESQRRSIRLPRRALQLLSQHNSFSAQATAITRDGVELHERVTLHKHTPSD